MSSSKPSNQTPAHLRAALAFAALCWAGAALAQVDTAGSTIAAVSRQMNVPVSGQFKQFSASVVFDPAHLDASHAQFSVAVASYDLGDPSYNQEVRGTQWFDAAGFPSATFVSTSIAPGAPGAYKVSGKLTIKGKTVDVVAPVSYKQDGDKQVFDGVVPIKRLQFDIGSGEWKDTSVVADEVQIKFHIVNVAKK
jgi:polyisoprenoid-binding protein YceI